MGIKLLTEIFCSRLKKREGLKDIYIRTFSFSQRTVNEWNISADCVGTCSLKIKSTYTYIPKKGGVHLDR